MQANLEEVKRNAFLEIGRSDVAPVHMKRQALRMAVTEDEIHSLRAETAQLKAALTKTRVWRDLTARSTAVAHAEEVAALRREAAEVGGRYWGNRQAVEEREDLLRQHLAHTQRALSQS
eukprot:TRINITY_DN5309_c0_g1_i1.p2 TRINITY_DN5309_c0_g1~~TRINITY_DN5309_c0_g1_i1.p2  ORF type:complete len:119 (-),score=58.69 TRINITY_DN5309_c0_g1_i1:116-472(-)